MSRLLDYYEEELNYLLEAGREFAKIHPERAQLLAPDDPRGRDPHVERLLEAFSFIAGRIRMRLDDDYPEFTRALLSLIWPHYLKPIPSMATIELLPKEGMVSEINRITRGALIDSDPVNYSVSCRFKTCYDVDLLPLAVQRAGVEDTGTGNGRIRIRFRLHKGADLSTLGSLNIRLHLVGESSITYDLYSLLTQSVAAMSVEFKDAENQVRHKILPTNRPNLVGFMESNTILPGNERSFPGFRLLQEYFLFPEKFLYLDFPIGLSIANARAVEAFDLILDFNETWPSSLIVSEQNFRLHCTPIINLFERDAEPIRLDRKTTEYRVMADFSRPDDYEVYDINSVHSISRDSRKRTKYQPYFTFGHLQDNQNTKAAPLYTAFSRPSPVGKGWRTYLSFPAAVKDSQLEAETISCELSCTNASLPKDLRIGEIRHPASGIPEFVRCGNISQPTKPVWPAMDEGIQWKFIAHLAFNMSSLSDADSMQTLLSLYGEVGSRQAVDANKRKIKGISKVQLLPATTLHQGAVVRGTEFRIDIQEDHFADRGDLRLFSMTMAEFLALYSSINSFVRLTVVLQPTGEIWTWNPKFSARSSL